MKSKSVISCFSLLLLGATSTISADVELNAGKLKGPIENIINGTLNKFLDGFNDPTSIPSFSTSFNNAVIKGDVGLTDFTLAGVKSIFAPSIKVHVRKPTAINLTVSIPNIHLSTNYDVTLMVGQILPFFGKGKLSLTLDSVSIDFYSMAKIKTLPPKIESVSNISLEFYVGKDTSFSIGGLMKNEEFSNLLMDLTTQFLPKVIDFLDTHKEDVGRVISLIVQYIIDNIHKVDLLTIDNFNKEIDSSFYPEINELGGNLVKDIFGIWDISSLLLLLNKVKQYI